MNILNALLLKNKTIRVSLLQIADVTEIESLIDRLRTNKEINIHKKKKKASYMAALDAYRDYLLFINSDDVTEPEGEEPVSDESSMPLEDKTGTLQVSFSDSRSYSYTRPSEPEYAGKHYSVRNWTQAYVQIVKFLFEDFPDKIHSLMGKSIRGKDRIDIADTTGSNAMLAPREIAEDLYLETNESADAIVEKARMLPDIRETDYESVIITYSLSRNTHEAARTTPAQKERTTSLESANGNASFYEWLTETQGMAEATGRSYASAINTANAFAREHGIGHGMICGTTDWVIVKETTDALFQTVEFIEFNQRQHNRFRAALQKYMEYLRRDDSAVAEQPTSQIDFDAVDFTPYREILSTCFPKGFRISSKLDMGRFRTFWLKKYGEVLPDSDDTVRKYIKHITIQYQDFVYLPETMLDKRTAERLLAYLSQCFKDGKNAVYFDAIYKEFQVEFVGTHINNSGMLRSYLMHINKGGYFIHRNYVTATADAEVNPADEVRDYLISAGVPVTVEDLKDALSHIDENEVFRVTAGYNSAEFVRNQKGEYFHADIIRFTQPEIDTITDLIQKAIDDKEYMGGKELTDAIEVKLPAIMERYPFLTWLGLRDVIAYKLRDVFSFKGKIISTYGQNLSMTDVFAHFAATHEHFTLEQLKLLKWDLDTPIYFDAVYANSLRISKDDFVSRDQEAFDIEATDAAISRFCTGDYIALKGISFFGSFPDAGFPWNGFLLEHYAADFSKKYKLMHLGFIAETPVGAIVKRSSRFENFNELLSAELAVSNIPLNRDNALQYLVDTGFLARRNYKGIEQILAKAKLQRSRKG